MALPLWSAEPAPPAAPEVPMRAVRLRAVGDVMLGRGIERQSQNGVGLLGLFERVAPLLRDADITFANLESVLATRGTPTREALTLRGHPNAALVLASVGIDVVSVANNHADDYDTAAFLESVERLSEAGILVSGTLGRPTPLASAPIILCHGLRTAFVSFTLVGRGSLNRVTDAKRDALITDAVTSARRSADLVVVSFHWGREYEAEPTERQRALGHLAIDAGASLVLGHHPHTLQGVEVYRGRAIVYSLGNFLFDQPWIKTRESVLVEWTTDERGGQALRLLPIVIGKRPYRPHAAIGDEAVPILAHLSKLSLALGTTALPEDGALRVVLPPGTW